MSRAFAPLAEEYSGTKIQVNDFLLLVKTLTANTLSVLPGTAHLAYFPKVSTNYLLPQLLSLSMVLFLIIRILRSSRFILNYRLNVEANDKIAQLSIVAFGITGVFIQAATNKIQSSYSKLGDVYISYLYGATGFILILYISLCYVAINANRSRIMFASSILVALTLLTNITSSSVLWHVNRVNTDILSSLSENSTNTTRCKLEEAWKATNHQGEYKTNVYNGLNRLFLEKNGLQYCIQLKNYRR